MSRPNTRRKKGSGSLEKRGNIWYAVWTLDGQKIKRSTGKTDRRDAVKELERLTAKNILLYQEKTARTTFEKDEITKQLEQYEESLPSLTLADGFDAFENSLQRKEVKDSTLRMYRCQYMRFVKWAAQHFPGVHELRQVDENIAGQFLHYILEILRLDNDTYNKYVSLFRNVWKILETPARIKVNPWTNFPARGKDPHSRRCLTIEEMLRVTAALKGEMKLLFAVGIYTGMRLSDCCLLDWGHIDLVQHFIHPIPRKQKTRSRKLELPIPIHPILYELLVDIPTTARTGYLLPGFADLYERKQSSVASTRIQRFFKSCGIQTQITATNGRKKVDVGFHSFRHTFVTELMNGGNASIELVQTLVGHKNPAMTRYYNHPQAEGLRNAVYSLPDVFQKGSIIDIPSTDITPNQEDPGK